MKILQIGKFYYPDIGGIESVLYEITEGINNIDGYRCDVLCANKKLKYEENIFKNYQVFRTASFGIIKSTSISPQMIYKLWKLRKKYDIVHIHHPDPMAFLALFLVRPSTKVIVHWHSDIIRQKKVLKYFLPLQRWVLNFSDKIITTSKNYKKHSVYLQEFQSKIVTIPIGISSDKFVNKDIKNNYKNKKIIFSIGRLVSYKGFIYLIKSAQYLNNDFMIVIAGDGPIKEELQQYIDLNNLNDKVILLGHITQKTKNFYLDICFVFCLPSITKAEAFGVVLLEAMKFSKPIVSSNIQESGMSWVNQDNKTGLLVKPKSPEALANAFLELKTNETLYEKFCKNSFERFKSLFKKEKMIISIHELYNSLIKSVV